MLMSFTNSIVNLLDAIIKNALSTISVHNLVDNYSINGRSTFLR
jgi:hypothetical protein